MGYAYSNSIFLCKSRTSFCSIPLFDVVHPSDRHSLLQLAKKKSQKNTVGDKFFFFEIAYVEKTSEQDMRSVRTQIQKFVESFVKGEDAL